MGQFLKSEKPLKCRQEVDLDALNKYVNHSETEMAFEPKKDEREDEQKPSKTILQDPNWITQHAANFWNSLPSNKDKRTVKDNWSMESANPKAVEKRWKLINYNKKNRQRLQQLHQRVLGSAPFKQ